MAIAAALILAVLASPAAAKATAPDTVWDQIFLSQAERMMREGALRIASGEYDQAVQVLARAVVTAPREPDARILLGSAYYWQGQVDEALTEFQEALKLDPKNAQAHQLIGIAYAWKGDVDAAYASFKEAARLAPDRPDILMNLGSVEEARGELSRALDLFRDAVRGEPEYPLYREQLGMLYARLGRVPEAQEQLETALRLYPGYQDALLELGALREREGDLDGAVDRFKRAVRLKPRDSVARFRLAAALLKQRKEREARSALSEAFEVTPSAKSGRIALSAAFGGKPSPGQGGESTSTAPAAGAAPADPVDQIQKNLERLPPGAEATVEIQLAYLPPPRLEIQKPGEGRGQLGGGGLGRALGGRLGAGAPTEAPSSGPASGPMIAKREFVLSADPKIRQGQIQRVVGDLRKAARNLPPGGRMHLSMNAQLKQGGQEGPAVSFEPRRVGNDLGLWVMGTGWMSLVEESMDDLAARDEAEARLAAGLGNLALGRGEPAAADFERAAREQPGEVLAYLGLAAARIEAGDEPGAAETYRRALKLDPKNQTAKEAIEWLKR